MNGTKPAFLEGKTMPQSYYEKPNPYRNAPSCNMNLLSLSRYAKKLNKPMAQLNDKEIALFYTNAKV